MSQHSATYRPVARAHGGVPTIQAAILLVAMFVAVGAALYFWNAAEASRGLYERERSESLRLGAVNAEMTVSHGARIVEMDRSLAVAHAELNRCKGDLKDANALATVADQRRDAAEKQLAYYLDTPGWRTKSAWGRIKRNMTESEVLSVLGDAPIATTDMTGFKGKPIPGKHPSDDYAWYYPNRDASSGRVRFDSTEKRVIDWEMPSQFR